MHFIWNLVLLSFIVFSVSRFLPGIQCKNFGTAVAVAVVYSIINFIFGWLLVLISLPAIFLTLGLFIFVINAVLLYVTDKMIEDYQIDNFGTTVVAAFFITIAHSFLKWIF
jgi:putative membrane protein